MKKVKKILGTSFILLSAGAMLAACAKKGKADANDNNSSGQSDVIDEEETELKITAEPKSSELNAPEGFMLKVGVNNEKLVQKYQWQINNGTEDNPAWVNLESSSAKTNTLFKPSTFADDMDRQYRCVIQDVNGEYLFSEPAVISINNAGEFVNASWVCGYVVEAGKELDLSTTNLGSGYISLNEKGDELSIRDVCLDNSNPIYDYFDSTVGLGSTYFNYPYESFKIKVEGTNVITNTYWQEDENSGGIPFCFNFLGLNNKCKDVRFEGDGTLSLTGGTHLIYSNTKVTLGCDMNFGKIGHRYSTGVYACEIEVSENVHIDANLNGFLFQTREPKPNDQLGLPIVNAHGPIDVTNVERGQEVHSGIAPAVNGDVKIKPGAHITLISSVPKVSVGSTDFHAISGMNNVVIDGAYIDMILEVNPKRFDESHAVGQMVAIQTHYGDIDISNSKINVHYRAEESNANILNGAALLSEEGDVNISKSNIILDGDTTGIYNFAAVYATNIKVSNKSYTEFNVISHGSVIGFNMQGELEVENSNILLNINSLEDEIEHQNFGVIGYGLNLVSGEIEIHTDYDRPAIAIVIGNGETERGYEAGYVPTKILCVLDEDEEVNVWSMEGSIHDYVYFETVYGLNWIEYNLVLFEFGEGPDR